MGAALNPKQHETHYSNMLQDKKYHIEHILPRKWNDYDRWTDETHDNALDTLGNLVPLEWRINIRAQNEFFSRKQDTYRDSIVRDAKALAKLNHWYPEDYEKRHKKILARLSAFLKTL